MARLTIDKLWETHEWVQEGSGLIVCVDKVGGGTLGRSYDGQWEVFVYDVTGAFLEEISVSTGMPHSHRWVADLVTEDLEAE